MPRSRQLQRVQVPSDSLASVADALNRMQDQYLAALNPVLSKTFDTDLLQTPALWEDLQVGMASLKPAGSQDPTFVKLKDDGAGSRGVYCWSFSQTTNQELFFQVQIPHAYKLGTDVLPHIHWCAPNGNAGNVVWALEISVATVHGTFGATTLSTLSAPAPGAAYQHVYSDFPAVSGSRLGLSAFMVCRLARLGSNGADTYGSGALLLGIDFHHQRDSLGSIEVGRKR